MSLVAYQLFCYGVMSLDRKLKVLYLINDFPVCHDQNPMTKSIAQLEVMRDEDIGQLVFLPQII